MRFFIVVLLLFACTSEDFRDDVILCEDAMNKLAECCPGFEPTESRACRYHVSNGCDGEQTVTSPAIDENESRCVLAQRCEALRAGGVCERARTVGARVTGTDIGGAPLEPSGEGVGCR